MIGIPQARRLLQQQETRVFSWKQPHGDVDWKAFCAVRSSSELKCTIHTEQSPQFLLQALTKYTDAWSAYKSICSRRSLSLNVTGQHHCCISCCTRSTLTWRQQRIKFSKFSFKNRRAVKKKGSFNELRRNGLFSAKINLFVWLEK